MVWSICIEKLLRLEAMSESKVDDSELASSQSDGGIENLEKEDLLQYLHCTSEVIEMVL